jgi:tripartite-type tricarboxylate transporter receptor subunit TctC
MAPLGTADDVVRKVNADLTQVLNEPQVRTKLAALGSYTHPLSPTDTVTFIQSEQRTWGPILDDLGRSP